MDRDDPLIELALEIALELHVGAAGAVQLRLPPGRMLVLEGPPGSGKSTLLAAVAGLDHRGLTSGRIIWGSAGWSPQGPCPRGVAWVPQDPREGFLCANVGEEVRIAGAPQPPDGLASGQDPRDLSRGEAWRLALFLALARAPRLLLLDEPSGSLDGAGLAWMRARLAPFLAAGGVVLAAEHRPGVFAGLPLTRHGLALAPASAPAAAACTAGPVVLDCAPVLEVGGLEACPGGRAGVGPLDLTLRPGERVGLCGANGHGKTTLLRAIVGFEPITAGSVAIAGWHGGAMPALATRPGRGLRHLGRRLRRVRPPRGIGYLPQNPDELLHGESVAAEIGPWMRGCPALLALLGLYLPA
ncbi:MAG: ATP-binding cassette domain-containing protein, partial [Pseudomonadota bacterium]